MIKLFKYILLIFFILTSLNYSLATNDNVYYNNTQINIKKAKLLENYVYNLDKNLKKFKNKYNIKSDKNLDLIEKELSIMIKNLKKIQKVEIKKEISEKIIKEIIKRLKIFTPKLKKILKTKKKIFELNNIKIKQKYLKLSDLLSKKTENIIFSLYNTIKNKKIYSLKDLKIIKGIKNLVKQNKNLKDFKSKKFKDKNEMKNELLTIIKNIRSEILEIKKVFKN
ncbi:hypothetical protein CSB08_01075 [Candidatus Gracilibacteria bacterium]|nr:MAG: hypothetical protein CSB08_01075 [Candidatus Gracilibacteria bacterium]